MRHARAPAGGARRGGRARAHDARRRERAADRPARSAAASRPRTCARHRGAARRRRRPPQGVAGSAERVLREVDRARRAAGVGPSFPILGYDDLTAAQVNERLGDLDAGRAAQGARLRAAQREPQVGARGDRAEAQVASGRRCHPRRPCPPPAPSPPAPRRGDELELTVDSLAYGGNGVARRDGYVVFVAGAVPGDRVRAVVGKAKRAYAEARAVEILEPSPDRIPPVADHPGAPWQVLPYERQLEVKAEQVDGGADADRAGSRASSSSRSSPPREQWRYRNKLEYSFGTGEDGELVCGFHAPGRFDRILPMADCKLASERGNELREQVLAECRAPGPRRLGPARAARLPAQPRRPRGPAHRRSSRSGSSPRPGKLDVDALIDAVPCDGPVLDADRGARREHPGRRDRAARRRAAAARARSATSTS